MNHVKQIPTTLLLHPLHPWVWPDALWKRLHADFAGPFCGHVFFVVIDTHSKWPEVKVMKSTTVEKTIETLRFIFAQHGLPEQLVTDNGPQFTLSKFGMFLKGNRIKHILTHLLMGWQKGLSKP